MPSIDSQPGVTSCACARSGGSVASVAAQVTRPANRDVDRREGVAAVAERGELGE